MEHLTAQAPTGVSAGAILSDAHQSSTAEQPELALHRKLHHDNSSVCNQTEVGAMTESWPTSSVGDMAMHALKPAELRTSINEGLFLALILT